MRTLVLKMTTLVVVCVLVITAGCNNSQEPAGPAKTPPAGGDAEHKEHKGGHSGHGTGPHEGTVADWGGGKYHVEFTVDHDKQEATVYILGDDEKTPTPIKAAEIQLAIKKPAFQSALKAAPQEGDPEGKASRFVGNHESLGVVMEYEGTISGEVDGTPYSGNFKEEPH
ncbi:MAG TPA: hypothetical protein VMX74_02385 [Pirellulales bacterium]|nr:hypothetical protein [Pirellulales bacterium]